MLGTGETRALIIDDKAYACSSAAASLRSLGLNKISEMAWAPDALPKPDETARLGSTVQRQIGGLRLGPDTQDTILIRGAAADSAGRQVSRS